MDVRLVIVRPFGSYRKGDVVSDPTEIAKILASESTRNVVRIPPVVVPGSSGNSAKDASSPRQES